MLDEDDCDADLLDRPLRQKFIRVDNLDWLTQREINLKRFGADRSDDPNRSFSRTFIVT
jgi:hypothetical protein